MTQSTPAAASGAPRNIFGIAALVLALVGFVSALSTAFIALIPGALAVLFGVLGWTRIRRGEATNRTVTVIGIVLGVGAVALGIWGLTLI